MAKSTDERGRIYLPKSVRDRFGDRYQIVELPGHIALFPVSDDPMIGIKEAVGDAFNDQPIDQLKAEARTTISTQASAETEESGSQE